MLCSMMSAALSAFDCNEYHDAVVTVSELSRSHGLFTRSCK